MKAAVVYFDSSRFRKIELFSNSLAKGISGQYEDLKVDVINGEESVGKKLSGYAYIVFFAVSLKAVNGFSGSPFLEFLKYAGPISSKKSSAFTVPCGLRNWKRLIKIMESLEGEGLIVKNSGIIKSEANAFETGRNLHVK